MESYKLLLIRCWFQLCQYDMARNGIKITFWPWKCTTLSFIEVPLFNLTLLFFLSSCVFSGKHDLQIIWSFVSFYILIIQIILIILIILIIYRPPSCFLNPSAPNQQCATFLLLHPVLVWMTCSFHLPLFPALSVSFDCVSLCPSFSLNIHILYAELTFLCQYSSVRDLAGRIILTFELIFWNDCDFSNRSRRPWSTVIWIRSRDTIGSKHYYYVTDFWSCEQYISKYRHDVTAVLNVTSSCYLRIYIYIW